MARGSRTPPKKEEEFLAKYLELQNVSKAARACKLPVHTGFRIVERFKAGAKVKKARKDMYARAVEEAHDRLVDTFDVVQERILVKDLTPAQLAKLAVDNGLKSFSYQNPKPQYFKGLVDAFKALMLHQKLIEGVGGDDGKPLLVINLTGEKAEPEAA